MCIRDRELNATQEKLTAEVPRIVEQNKTESKRLSAMPQMCIRDSFSAGFGLVTSESEEEYNLIDINSDGLPDKVWKNGDGITVALNTCLLYTSRCV